jgi:ribosomal protein L40E
VTSAPENITAERSVGNTRDVGFVVVMFLVTLGIYFVYWSFISFEEVKRFRGRGFNGLVGAALVLLGVGAYLLPAYVGRMEVEARKEARQDLPPRVNGTIGFWILLPLVGLLIWMVEVQSALNAFWADPTSALAAQEQETFGEKECMACGTMNSEVATRCRKCRQPFSALQ